MHQFTRSSRRVLSLLTCTFLSLVSEPAPQAQAAPNHQAQAHNADNAYEVIPRVSIRARSRDLQTVNIASQRYPMELELHEDHDLVHAQTAMVRNGQPVSFNKSGHAHPLVGHVVGEPESAVQLVRTKRGIEGMVLAQGRVFELKAGPEGRSLFGEVKDLAAFAHQQGAHTQPGTCGVEDDDDDHTGPDAALAEVNPRNFEPGAQGCREAEIVLVADNTYINKLGSIWQAEFEMMRRMGEINLIFRRQLGVRFRVQKIYSYPDAETSDAPPFNTARRNPTPLDEFRTWKGQTEPDVDVAHLFVARTTIGQVGLARRNSVCGGKIAASVSNYRGDAPASALLVAHELGHNFGARHDTNVVMPQIMAAATGNTDPEFSKASIQQIRRRMLGFDCLKTTRCETIRSQQPDTAANPPSDPSAPTSEAEDQSKPLGTSGNAVTQSHNLANTEPAAPAIEPTNPEQSGGRGSNVLQRCTLSSSASDPSGLLLFVGVLGFALPPRTRRWS